jgi:hypothetical protein
MLRHLPGSKGSRTQRNAQSHSPHALPVLLQKTPDRALHDLSHQLPFDVDFRTLVQEYPMMTNPDTVARFERLMQRAKPLTLAERFALLEGMYELAANLEGFRPLIKDEHLVDTIQLVRNLQSLVQTSPR